MNGSAMNFTLSEELTNSTKHFTWPYNSTEISAVAVYTLFGLPAHFYVIWLIVKGQGSGVASQFFNLNLSVCEISFCFNYLLSLLSFLSQGLITITQCFVGLGITGRPLFQCLMCVERYLAVVHPVTFLKYKPLRYRVICCCVVWIIILGSCLFCMLTLASDNSIGFVWYFSVLFLVLLSLQLFCLVAVLRALKQSGPGERKREKEKENHMKKRAFYLILLTTVSIVIIFVPLIFSGFLSISTRDNMETHRTFGLTSFILAGFVQPVLFLHRAGKLSFPCLTRVQLFSVKQNLFA